MDTNKTYKLPSLIEFLNENKKGFDLSKRVGLAEGVTWEQHAALLTEQWKMMSQMDPIKLREFINQRYRKNLPMYMALKEDLDKKIKVRDLRASVDTDVREIRERKK